MKIRMKRILAYILMVTTLMGNTMSASASGIYMGQDASMLEVSTEEMSDVISIEGKESEISTNEQESVSQIEESTVDFDEADVTTEEETDAEEKSDIEEKTTVEEESDIEEETATEEESDIEEETTAIEESSTEEETTAIEGSTEESTDGEELTTEEVTIEETESVETITEIEETLEAIDILGENVEAKMVLLLAADEQDGQYLAINSYGTLQEALNAIESLDEPQNYYRIELGSAQEDVITSGNRTLVFPKKTAGLTIAAANELTEPFVFFKGNITLKSNIKFEDIIFVPASKAGILLGNYSLTLSRCSVDESKGGGFGAVSGSNVNGESQLILEDTQLRVLGAVNKVGSVVFTSENLDEGTQGQVSGTVRLLAEGKINVGSIILEADGILTGIATVTRKNGRITKVVPQITIAEDVISDKDKVLYLDLQEKVAGSYIQLDLDKEDAQDIQRGGIYFAKAAQVSYPHIKALQRNEEDNLVKTAGYLTYYVEQYGTVLSFIEDGMEKLVPCKTFADAVTEINNRKIKRDYVITLTKDCAVVTGVRQDVLAVAPKALTMPNKKYISSLVIQADPSLETEKTVQLGFTGNLTFTSDVTLCNVEFVQMVKKGTSYLPADVAKDDYPAAVSVKTGGFALAIAGEVTINTPVLLNGGNKGSLVFERGSTFTTLTNDQEKTFSDSNNTIFGSITGFDKVIVEGCDLRISEYQTARNGSYKASANTITNLELIDANLAVVGENTNAALTVKNLYVDNAEVYVAGKINLTNATLEGSQKATVFADREFVISGKLTSNSNNATLLTRLRGKGKAPYLTINGNVVRLDGIKPIYVGVYHWDTASEAIRNDAVVLTNAPKVSAQLLTAKKASAVDFRPLSENYGAGSGEYHKDNTSGYMMMKSGSNIYVYEGSKVKIAVYVKHTQEEDGNGELFGFFPSMKEATTAVNAKKDRAAYYTYLLMEKNGTVKAPVTFSLPSYAKQVTITSIPDCKVDMKTITFSGKLTLGADTIFKDVILAPVSKAKGTAFSIATGGNDLTLEEVSISEQLSKAVLKNISGNGKQTIVLDSPDLQLAGSVTNVAKLVIKESTCINGSVKASLLRLENNNEGEAVILDARSSITLTNLENAGVLANTLSYTRTSKNLTNLTINGYIYNESSKQPVILKQDEQRKITAVYQNGMKAVLNTTAMAAVMPKASTDSFILDAVVTDREGEVYADISSLQAVKAKNGIYLVDISDEEMLSSTVNLISVRGNERTVTYCLDYTQAVSEINNRADKQADYTICFVAEEEERIDLNLTDAKKYSAFSMPKKNTKASLIIKPAGAESVCVPFTGNITAYGNVTLQNLVLNPVKSASSDTPINVKLITNADTTGAFVRLDKVVTKEQLLGEQFKLGYISDIKGTKNKTEFEVQNCEELYFASGISNVKSVSLKESRILSAKNSTITNLELDKTSAWVVLGKFTVSNVNMPEGVIHSYVGVKQNLKENPQLTISGSVNSGTLLVRLFEVDTALAEGFELFETTSDKEIESYLNVPLALAPKADVSDIRAYAYRVIDETGTVAANADGVGQDNFASHKDGDYIKNGTQDSMFLAYGSKELRISAEEADKELEQVAQEKNLYALIYMADSYDVKEAANKQSATVTTLQSGHTVQVIGMDVEWTYSSEWEEYIPTVWYFVQFYIGETLYKGYVEESFLAYSDEILLQWKNDWYMLFPLDKSQYATAAADYSDVAKFPTSYQVYLNKLKKDHPNWTFVPMNVGREWKDCVNEQMGNYSWIYHNQPAKFRGAKINDLWYYASKEGIEYYMDPRNFLTESYIFQFEQNTYNASYHTQSALQSFLSNTFMSGKVQGDSQGRTYAYVIWNSGKTRGLSPFNLAARVIQEQGVKGTSSMISGTYPGYEGYYNHYNIQASGTTDAEVIRNGLAYAKKMGWNTRVKSLDGGAAFIGNGYILKGQDTLYLQKFDVEHGSDSLHQYMQNIMAPYTEGQSMKKMYSEAGSLNSNFVFKIPVFNNMPEANYTLSPKSVKLEKGKTKQLTLKYNGITISASEATYISSDEAVATVSKSGLITALHSGNAVITATVGEGDKKVELTCNVKVYAPLKSISLDIEETNLYVAEGLPDKVAVLLDGKTTYLNKEDCPTQTVLNVVYNPEDTTDDKTTIWTVENPDIVELEEDAEVPGKAMIKAKAGGATRITAKVGKTTATVSVTVRVPMAEASLKLDGEQITLYKGEKTRVNISYAPYETTDFIDPVWSSDDETIAKIVDGEIVAVGEGTTTLYASVGPFVGSQADVLGLSCKVTVKEYSVSFMDTDGSLILKTTGEYGSSLEHLVAGEEIPWQQQKEGFVFAGWYTEPNGGGFAVDEQIILHGDMVLYPYFIDAAEGFYAGPIGDVSYTGAYLKPKVEVYNGEQLLAYGMDYTVTYVNNKAVNDPSKSSLQPTAIIYGKGLYSGKQYKAYFDIVPKDISHTDVTAGNLLNAYTGKEQQMRPVLYDGGRILQRDVDYTLSYLEDAQEEGAYLEAGTYAVEVHGMGNYSGSRIIYVTISKRTPMSEVSVGSIADMKFNNGKEYASSEEIVDCIPETLAVTYDGAKLQEGVDYTLEYVNNREIGTATVILTGMGDYIGTTTKSFRITGTAVSAVVVRGVSNVEYTGQVAKQDASKIMVINKKGILLREGLDYTLDIERITAGKAYVTIAGMNGYYGMIKKSFLVKPYNIAVNSQTYSVEGENGATVEKPAFDIQMDNNAVEYDKAGAQKPVEVTFKGKTLVEGVDYKLSYENTQSVVNEKGVAPTVTITGIGNFTGVVNKTFTLTQKDFSKVTMKVNDVMFRNRKGFCFTEPVLMDESGRYLVAGKDYEEKIIYTYENDTVLYNGDTRLAGTEVLENDIPAAGSVIRVTVSGKNNYMGTISDTFEILENSSWLEAVLQNL